MVGLSDVEGYKSLCFYIWKGAEKQIDTVALEFSLLGRGWKLSQELLAKTQAIKGMKPSDCTVPRTKLTASQDALPITSSAEGEHSGAYVLGVESVAFRLFNVAARGLQIGICGMGRWLVSCIFDSEGQQKCRLSSEEMTRFELWASG